MIQTIDVDYVRPGLAACHLLVDSGQAAFMDTGTSRSIPRLEAALEAAGLTPAAVRYVCPTHVHLDHAGGAGQLMQMCPNAVCLLHPRGARHMIDPARLIAGSLEVYGAETMEALYGEILPIDPQRVETVADGERRTFGNTVLQFLHTEGHARHHYCVVDRERQAIFSGDTLGISYRDFDTSAGPFVFATTTPVQFDPDAWHLSLDRIRRLGLDRACLTHFGQVAEVDHLLDMLKRSLHDFVAVAEAHAEATDRTRRMSEALLELLCARLDEHGDTHSHEARAELLAMDVQLNVMGMEVWLDRRASKAKA